MRAVIGSPAPDADAGGIERFCHHLAALLDRLGYDVTLVGPPTTVPSTVARLGWAPVWAAGRIRAAAAGADLVITNGLGGWPGRWAARRVHVFHGHLLRLTPHIEGRADWRLRWGLGVAVAEGLGGRGATTVAVADHVARSVRRAYGVRVDAVVENGVDTSIFRPRPKLEARRRLGLDADRRCALFVGRGEPGKGPGVALDGARRAGFDLLAAGTRPVDGSRPLGVLAPEGLAWAYAAADAVVLPTRYEGLPYVALEALACRVPIVTTALPWAAPLLAAAPAYRPLLVAPEADAVSAALRLVADGGGRIEAAADQGFAHVLRRHTLDAFEQRWTELLSSIDAVPARRRG